MEGIEQLGSSQQESVAAEEQRRQTIGSDNSAVLERLLSRNAKSAKARRETRDGLRSARISPVKPDAPVRPPESGPGRLSWAIGVLERVSPIRNRPGSASAFVHTLHPVASFAPTKYGKFTDLDAHIAGALEHRDGHRDLLEETMQRMAHHNDRLRLEAAKLRQEHEERAARTIQLYWRMYRQKLRERRKRERRMRNTGTWQETVRRHRPHRHRHRREAEAHAGGEQQEQEVEEDDGSSTSDGSSGSGSGSEGKEGGEGGKEDLEEMRKEEGEAEQGQGDGNKGKKEKEKEKRKKDKKRRTRKGARVAYGEAQHAGEHAEHSAHHGGSEHDLEHHDYHGAHRDRRRSSGAALHRASSCSEREPEHSDDYGLQGRLHRRQSKGNTDHGAGAASAASAIRGRRSTSTGVAGLAGEAGAGGAGSKPHGQHGARPGAPGAGHGGAGRASAPRRSCRRRRSSSSSGGGSSSGTSSSSNSSSSSSSSSSCSSGDSDSGDDDKHAAAAIPVKAVASYLSDARRHGGGDGDGAVQAGAVGGRHQQQLHPSLPRRSTANGDYALAGGGVGDGGSGSSQSHTRRSSEQARRISGLQHLLQRPVDVASPWGSDAPSRLQRATSAAAEFGTGSSGGAGNGVGVGGESSPRLRQATLELPRRRSAQNRMRIPTTASTPGTAGPRTARGGSTAAVAAPAAPGFGAAGAATGALLQLQGDARNIPSYLRVVDHAAIESLTAAAAVAAARRRAVSGTGYDFGGRPAGRPLDGGPSTMRPLSRSFSSLEPSRVGREASSLLPDPAARAGSRKSLRRAMSYSSGQLPLARLEADVDGLLVGAGGPARAAQEGACPPFAEQCRGSISGRAPVEAAAADGAPLPPPLLQVDMAVEATCSGSGTTAAALPAQGGQLPPLALRQASGSGSAHGAELSLRNLEELEQVLSGRAAVAPPAPPPPPPQGCAASLDFALAAGRTRQRPAPYRYTPGSGSTSMLSSPLPYSPTPDSAAMLDVDADISAAAAGAAAGSRSEPSTPLRGPAGALSSPPPPPPPTASISESVAHLFAIPEYPINGTQQSPGLVGASSASPFAGAGGSASAAGPYAGGAPRQWRESSGSLVLDAGETVCPAGVASWGPAFHPGGLGLTPEASYASLYSQRSAAAGLAGPPQPERSAPALLSGGAMPSPSGPTGLPWRYRCDALRAVFTAAQLGPAELMQRVMTPPRGVRGRTLATPQAAPAPAVREAGSPRAGGLAAQVTALLLSNPAQPQHSAAREHRRHHRSPGRAGHYSRHQHRSPGRSPEHPQPQQQLLGARTEDMGADAGLTPPGSQPRLQPGPHSPIPPEAGEQEHVVIQVMRHLEEQRTAGELLALGGAGQEQGARAMPPGAGAVPPGYAAAASAAAAAIANGQDASGTPLRAGDEPPQPLPAGTGSHISLPKLSSAAPSPAVSLSGYYATAGAAARSPGAPLPPPPRPSAGGSGLAVFLRPPDGWRGAEGPPSAVDVAGGGVPADQMPSAGTGTAPSPYFQDQPRVSGQVPERRLATTPSCGCGVQQAVQQQPPDGNPAACPDPFCPRSGSRPPALISPSMAPTLGTDAEACPGAVLLPSSAPSSPSPGAGGHRGSPCASPPLFWASAQPGAPRISRLAATGPAAVTGSHPQSPASPTQHQQLQQQQAGVTSPTQHAPQYSALRTLVAAPAQVRGYAVSPHGATPSDRAGTCEDLLLTTTLLQRAASGSEAGVAAAAPPLAVQPASPLGGGRRPVAAPEAHQTYPDGQQSALRVQGYTLGAGATEVQQAGQDGLAGGDGGASGGLPSVPAPPVMATRLVVKRAAPVLRLPVVLASQAAAQQQLLLQQFARQGTSPGSTGGGGAGASRGTDSYTVVTASCNGMVEHRTASSAAGSAGPNGSYRLSSTYYFTPESHLLTPSVGGSSAAGMPGHLRRPLDSSGAWSPPPSSGLGPRSSSPPPPLSPEVSRASVVSEGAAAADEAGGSGGGAGSKAALREWRGLEKWWQAKGLDAAAVQFRKQPARQVYL